MYDSEQFCVSHFVHLHLQRGEQTTSAFAHLQIVHSPLHEHLMSSLQVLDTSGIVTNTGSQVPGVFVQSKSCGDGMCGCGCVQVVQIPA